MFLAGKDLDTKTKILVNLQHFASETSATCILSLFIYPVLKSTFVFMFSLELKTQTQKDYVLLNCFVIRKSIKNTKKLDSVQI